MRYLIVLALCFSIVLPCTASPLIPTIANSGFEETVQGNDAPGWGWYTRAKASFHSETANPHSGERCLVFTNESSLEPEIYGRLFQTVPLMPGMNYELSLWVRGQDVAGGIHLTDWSSYTLNIPEGTYGWRKVSTIFHTGDGQNSVNLGINIVNRCSKLAIDDVSLRPVGRPFKGKGIEGSVLVPDRVEGDDAPAYLRLVITSALPAGATVHAVIGGAGQTLLNENRAVNPGENILEAQWTSGKLAARELDLTVRVLDAGGKCVASVSKRIAKTSPALVSQDIDRIEARLAELDRLAAMCQARGIPTDYPMAARTMLAQFIPLEREDLQHNDLRRAGFAVRDFDRSVEKAITELRAYLRHPETAPVAVRYRTSDTKIDGISFVGDRVDSRGKTSRGPVFFCGYGHFQQARKDIPIFPGYGVNIIQSAEFGPSAVFPSENQVSYDAINTLVQTLDDAAKHNVRVDVLISPHYFPDWAMKKWPHLGKGGGGFLGYVVDEPEARQVVEKFLRILIPMIKDKPALHSLCLSNEPIFGDTARADNTGPMWASCLADTHGDLATMNARYGRSYSSFSDVPIPPNDAYGDPSFYDFCVFNQKRFAGWHQRMADVIHEMAPRVPVHAKCMNMIILQRYTIAWGVDPERFCRLSQINGNDCTMWAGATGGWALSWGVQNITYDMQRSFARHPIFNSENHLTYDTSTSYVAPEHFRTALWQGAIHGQGATTIWVWERTFDRGNCFYGNVMDRPGCAEAVGRTCLDLNRFADEVTALQKVKSPVAILYSMASMVRSSGHPDAISQVYTALNFCGVKIDFISENQLAAGRGRDYRMIVLPEATHLPPAAYAALCDLPAATRLVAIGAKPSMDPYGGKLPSDPHGRLAGAVSIPYGAPPEKLRGLLVEELGEAGGLPEISLVDAATGRPIWGVEWLPARTGDRTVVNIVDLLDRPVEVKLLSSGKPIEATDLLSLGGSQKVRKLAPMTPVLASFRSP